jgi:hypothetical protein
MLFCSSLTNPRDKEWRFSCEYASHFNKPLLLDLPAGFDIDAENSPDFGKPVRYGFSSPDDDECAGK